MKRNILTLMAGALMLGMSSMSAMAAGKNICVSWKTFQEERWKTDEAAIKAVVEAAGDKFISADAQTSAAKQLTDIEGLITQGCNVIMVVAFDSDAILPAFQSAADAGVKMLSYDVLVEHPDALYVTFDNVGVGRLMAKTMLESGKAEGDFAFIKGDKGDPNATFLFEGIMEVLKPNMDAGKIKNVCETFTDSWKPDVAQKNMEQCLTSVSNKVDAVISENDGMAGGVVAALEAQGLAGTVPVTGQDGDHAALNRVALGTQLVSVWKDARVLGKRAAEAAVAIAAGTDPTTLEGVAKFSGGQKGV
ncbi:MAG TPA: substrate-binding domain-containing protein, partial [Aestuariivirga sp.]|nr:substrate-binding domain-containing protein [Aestuariivirga sp.]